MLHRSGLLCVVALTLATVAAASGEPAPGALSANTVRLPDGPGSVRGLSDDVGVDGFSAQVRYDVPLELPAGRAGMKPSLALSYSGDLGNGPLGVGWTLSLPAIRRSTRQGPPSFTASDELELVGIGGGGRLIPVPDGSLRLERQPYAVKVDRQGEGFVVLAPGGVRYLLGATAASRQGEGSQVTAWMLERVVHPTGEQIAFQYLQDSGEVYLAGASWGPADCYRLTLGYELRPDQVISFRAGMRVKTAQRLKTARVVSFGETLREYQLAYDDSLPLSRLASVRMVGRGGEGELPPLTFRYAPLQEATAQQLQGLEGWALNELGVSLADVDGDGITDLLRLDPVEGHSWRKGWGEHFGAPVELAGPASASLSTSRLMDLDGDARPELVLEYGDAWQPYGLTAGGWVHRGEWAGTAGLGLMDANLFFADLNGDGRVDVIRNATDSLQVKWNLPAGLGPWEVHPGLGSSAVMLGGNLRLQEVNGDGLADVIEVTPDFVQLFLGRGDGTFSAEGVHFYPWPEAVSDLSNLRFGDLNRDGLMDLVRLLGGAVAWYPGVAQGGFSASGRIFEQPSEDFTAAVVALADVNGNGSEDLVWSNTGSTWRLDLAGATSAGMLVGLDNGLGKTLRVAYDASAVLSAAAEGAGRPWTQRLPVSIPVPTWVEVSPGAGAPVRKVRHAPRDGFWDPEERKFAGFLFSTTTTVGDDPQSTLVEETRYHPGLGEDRALRGLVQEASKRTGAGVLFTTEYTQWEARAVQGMPDTALLRMPARLETRTLHSEGVSPALETLHRWSYDPRVRPTTDWLFGRLDVEGDESVVDRVYASDEASWIHDAICEERVYAAEQQPGGTGVVLQRAAVATSQTRNFYGDANGILEWTDPALCQVGRGLSRRQQGWLDSESGSRWITLGETRYDAWDNVVATFEDGVWRSLQYDADALFPISESIQPNAERTVTWTVTEWDRVLGAQKRVTDPNGVTVAMEYDSLGRPLATGLDGQPAHLRYRYDWTAPRPQTWTYLFDGDSSELAGSWTGSWEANGKWRESVRVSNGEGEALYTAIRLEEDRWIISGWRDYDGRGELKQLSDGFYAPGLPTAVPEGVARQTFTHDALGRLTRQTLPTMAARTVDYRAFGASTLTEGLAPVSTSLDGVGRILRTERTVAGALESVSATYDAQGRLRSMRLNDGAAEHAFRYDTLGRLVGATDPDIGARSLEYNDAGWVLKHTNGAGQSRTFAYDDGGRLVSTGGDGAEYRYHYDAPKPGTAGENLVGRLAWVEEPRGEVQLSYDAFGRTVRHARWVEGRSAEELMEFGLSGLQTRGSVDGLVLTPSYDRAGRSIALGNYWQAVELDATGRVLAEAYGNGVTQRYTRDELGMPKEIGVARPSGLPLYGVRVGRTAWGSPRWVEDTDGVGLDHSATFAYDDAGRLADVVLGAAKLGAGPATGADSFAVGPQSFHFTYAYDALQNMTSRTAAGPKVLDLYAGSYRYGERGLGPRQLSSVATAGGEVSLGYDAAGRVVTQDGRTHTYNGLDQLVRVSVPARGATPAQTVTHAYGYDGLRTVTEGDGATQYWLTPNLVEREGKREWYLRRDDRTLVRLTLNGNEQLAAAAGSSRSGGGLSAGLSAGVRLASSGVLAGLMGLALLLGAVAAARARSGARWQRLHVGVLLAAMLGLSCRGGENPDLGETAKALRWAIAGVVYFHGGIAAGPVVMTREDGTVYEERRYEPFGVPIDAFREASNGAAEVGEINHRAEPLNVLNKETDATSGYSYHGSRWLSPHTANWLTPDPPVKGPDPKFLDDPWGLHPYQFVKQNPVAYWDPDGNEEKPSGWQKLGAFAWGAAKGVAVGVGTAVVIGAISAVAAPLAVVVVVGMTAYGAYGLVNGGAEALADTGKRLINGEGTLEDFDTAGQFLGGLASGRMAKAGFQKGQSMGAKARPQKTPAPAPKSQCSPTSCPCSFVAATLVDTEAGLVPIDAVALGERIGPESQECAEMDLAGWIEVHLETEVTDAGQPDLIQLQLLRPISWLLEHPARAGERMAIHLEEFKLQGEADVTYVGPAPGLKPGRRCPVIGRLQHSSRELISLTLEGEGQPLQVTKEHPVYSAERDDWVKAANLRPGEVLRTRSGTASVREVLLSAQPRTEVFDLQVAGTSSYFVSDAKVLAHNCPDGGNVGSVPKSPRGKGSVAPADRDPVRKFTPAEKKLKLAEQNGKCPGCDLKIKPASNGKGHHVKRHADGGPTSQDNHVVVCHDCHLKIHGPD